MRNRSTQRRVRQGNCGSVGSVRDGRGLLVALEVDEPATVVDVVVVEDVVVVADATGDVELVEGCGPVVGVCGEGLWDAPGVPTDVSELAPLGDELDDSGAPGLDGAPAGSP